MPDRNQNLWRFSEDDEVIGAECPACGRVLRVDKARLRSIQGGFSSPNRILCKCGKTYNRILVPVKKTSIPAARPGATTVPHARSAGVAPQPGPRQQAMEANQAIGSLLSRVVWSNDVWLPLSRAEIETPSDAARNELRLLIESLAKDYAEEGIVQNLRLTISGYDSDPRELHEIPQVCQWAKETFRSLPRLWVFLDKQSQDRFVGWLCGPVTLEEIKSRKFEEQYDRTWEDCASKSMGDVWGTLAAAGVSPESATAFVCRHSRLRIVRRD